MGAGLGAKREEKKEGVIEQKKYLGDNRKGVFVSEKWGNGHMVACRSPDCVHGLACKEKGIRLVKAEGTSIISCKATVIHPRRWRNKLRALYQYSLQIRAMILLPRKNKQVCVSSTGT